LLEIDHDCIRGQGNANFLARAAHAVQAFLDANGTPLRNVHKLEPLIRLPLVLGLAHLLGRLPLPGGAPRREWMHAFAHPENDKRVAVGIVVLVALATGTSLAWTGRLTPRRRTTITMRRRHLETR
jgi:arabinofuranan 3-O-arabinosyltransferase